VVGAAMPVALLAEHRDWLIGCQRDLELQDPISPEVLDGDWQGLARRANDLLDGHRGRRGVHGPFDGLALGSRDPRVRALASDRLRQGLEFAGAVGASHMVVHSPFVFFGDAFLPHAPSFDRAAQLELVRQTLEPVLGMARAIGCVLVIEGIFDKNPEPLQALVRAIGSPLVCLSVDVGHAYITHLAGGPTPDGWVRAAGELLEHVHLQDTDGRADRHWAPGDGQINWFALFEAIRALPRPPRLLLEVREGRQIRRGADWLVRQGLAR
jgi:sugar phosphate isomerase/epimerase